MQNCSIELLNEDGLEQWTSFQKSLNLVSINDGTSVEVVCLEANWNEGVFNEWVEKKFILKMDIWEIINHIHYALLNKKSK